MNYILDTKRARIQIIHIENQPTLWNVKKIHRNIQDLKNHLEQIKNVKKEQKNRDYLQQEIKKLRAYYKTLVTPKKYTFLIFIKQYQKEIKISLNYNPFNYPKKDKDEKNHPLSAFKSFLKEAVDEAVRSVRREIKVRSFVQRFGPAHIEKFGSKKLGMVNAVEMSVLKTHVHKNIRNLYDGKTPTTFKKYIGIELEFCAPIKEELFALKLFQHGIHKYAQLKQDGSLRPNKEKNENGFELAILLEENSYKKDLKKITNLLRDIKAITQDRRCGLHVHLDMRRRKKDLVYNNLVACQYALLSIVEPSRYNNEFCQVVQNRKIPTKFTGDRFERYKTINAAAYYKYKTLEVRMHEGSINYDEIAHWVDMLIKIANYTRKLKDDVTELDIMQKRFKFKSKLYTYALERSCSWQLQNNPQTQNMREDIQNLQYAVERNRIRPPEQQIRIDIETNEMPPRRLTLDEARALYPPDQRDNEPRRITFGDVHAPDTTIRTGAAIEAQDANERLRIHTQEVRRIQEEQLQEMVVETNRILGNTMPTWGNWDNPIATLTTTTATIPNEEVVDFRYDLDDNETDDDIPF